MSEITAKHIRRILLKERDLSVSIQQMHQLLQDRNVADINARLADIEQEYQLMKDYFMKGYNDPDRDKFYVRMLQKIYVLACDYEANGNYEKPQPSDVATRLENFVETVAMASLEPEETKEEKLKTLYETHQRYVNQTFEGIVYGRQWSEAEAKQWSEIVVSPKIEVNDALVLTSAVAVANTNCFDLNKFSMLLSVWKQAQDEPLRQRALTGWALSLPHPDTIVLFPRLNDWLQDVCDEQTCRQLLELQMQIVFCQNADNDGRAIQRDIMPTLMKNNPLKITPFGIEEKEDDKMNEILHPDASDKAMEEIEQGMQKMMEMQQQGADIYFGGFAQMKRFGFFQRLANWFMPFSFDHPEIRSRIKTESDHKMMQILLERTPLCDSDKYSLVISMAGMLDKMPANLREAMKSADVSMVGAGDMSAKNDGAFVRRMYVQNLYRFYRLHPQKDQFVNPFTKTEQGGNNLLSGGCFMANHLLATTQVKKVVGELGRFLVKKQKFSMLDQLLEVYGDAEGDLDIMRLVAWNHLRNERYDQAISTYERCLDQQKGNKSLLRGLGQAYFRNKQYDKAVACFVELIEKEQPSPSLSSQLQLAIAQTSAGDLSSSLNTLYKLNYENADDINVKRALAWALLNAKEAEKAEKLWRQIVDSKDVEASDKLNMGYSLWFQRKISEATEQLKSYCQDMPGAARKLLSDAFRDDADLLKRNGITAAEIRMILDF